MLSRFFMIRIGQWRLARFQNAFVLHSSASFYHKSHKFLKSEMGYLDNFNQAQKAGIFEHWMELNDEQQLQEILEVSKTKPVVIFKHSTTCGISESAKYALMDNWDFSDQDLDLYYLDLLKYRSISNRVAEDFGVTHQSPQVLLIKDGKVAAYTSHHRIGVQWLKNNL